MRGSVGNALAAVAGVGLCLLALIAWRLPTSGSPPGLDLRLIAVPPGELTVEPVGVIASARALQAGDAPARGTLTVRNIAGRRLRVRLAALPSLSGLAGAVRLRASAGEAVLASGTVASLERPRGVGIEIPAHGDRRIELSAWLPAGARGYRGRILDLTLELDSQQAGRR